MSSPMSTTPHKVHIDDSVVHGEFVSEPAATPLRICCYGSSSSKTPAPYLVEARNLGYILARRGHTCVNGAGSFGCMAAMNDGAATGCGSIVGVIHEMFVVDGNDWVGEVRDGGAHRVFHPKKDNVNDETGVKREMLVAGGSDLQERKRLLVEGADGLVVLPGGPGTWDELWEMACARNIGLTTLPIVCVNVDGYYENFRAMLQRSYVDELIKMEPDQIVHFEDTAEAAIRWLEMQAATKQQNSPRLRRRNSALQSSFMAPPVGGWSWFRKSISWVENGLLRGSSHSGDDDDDESWLGATRTWKTPRWTMPFVAGVAVGVIATLGEVRRRTSTA